MTPRRPRPLDAVLVGALVLIVAGVVFLQLHLGGDKNAGKASPSPSPTYLQTSVGNPYPDPTPTGVPSTPQASSSAASSPHCPTCSRIWRSVVSRCRSVSDCW